MVVVLPRPSYGTAAEELRDSAPPSLAPGSARRAVVAGFCCAALLVVAVASAASEKHSELYYGGSPGQYSHSGQTYEGKQPEPYRDILPAPTYTQDVYHEVEKSRPVALLQDGGGAVRLTSLVGKKGGGKHKPNSFGCENCEKNIFKAPGKHRPWKKGKDANGKPETNVISGNFLKSVEVVSSKALKGDVNIIDKVDFSKVDPTNPKFPGNKAWKTGKDANGKPEKNVWAKKVVHKKWKTGKDANGKPEKNVLAKKVVHKPWGKYVPEKNVFDTAPKGKK